MVKKGVRPPLGEDQVFADAFSKCCHSDSTWFIQIYSESWTKIDVDNDGQITYDEFIAGIVKNEITNY